MRLPHKCIPLVDLSAAMPADRWRWVVADDHGLTAPFRGRTQAAGMLLDSKREPVRMLKEWSDNEPDPPPSLLGRLGLGLFLMVLVLLASAGLYFLSGS